MGAYLNPGFAYFEACTKGFFIDKTELISFIDRKLGTKESLMLVSRPRRFGKTLAAHMLSAYYGSGYDSRRLFENRRIAKLDPSLTGINSYHVLFLDVSSFWTQVKTWQSKENEESREANRTPRQLDWIGELVKDMEADLIKSFGESVKGRDLYETLENIVEVTGKKFLWICDEWDMFFREACPDPHVQRNYLEFLRRLFKSGDYTLKVFIGAYMTGILPMKKIKGQSAISDFSEYSMLLPRDLSSFYGFTQDEVKIICKKENLPLAETEKWYDGYQIGPMT
ncbi:MAG: AAA family ATPase, partial [Blautia sp.]|nr:AAA family ATPase [Blautia sp.]